ncbi:hypothetical protein F2Q70_00004583 [Brassica cretica]|uniref:Uncharacterized protein n=1 Tax=Brassica cretica TaxID=69181 RepID=A0A8S9ILA0_BRACR|nr:hypothetical protein F2Q70_00004583 [Brassica cretica]KAF3568437.1 hypothetical protein DY000_02016679 [Brassica cretica]
MKLCEAKNLRSDEIAVVLVKGKEVSKAETKAGKAGPTVTESDIQHIIST